MSDGKKHRVHTAESKAKVGLEAIRGVKTMTEIAQEYSAAYGANSAPALPWYCIPTMGRP